MNLKQYLKSIKNNQNLGIAFYNDRGYKEKFIFYFNSYTNLLDEEFQSQIVFEKCEDNSKIVACVKLRYKIDNITEEIRDKIKNDVERMFGLVMC